MVESSDRMETGESLLLTKLFVPQVRPNRVARPGLVARLTQALSGKLTLVSAPAGFGKTTLVADWLTDLRCTIPDPGLKADGVSIQNRQSQIQNRVAWLSLDDGDNDPNRFLAYLAAALQEIQSDWSQSVQELLSSPQPPALTAVMAALINAIAASDSPPFVLVLDDYHLISASCVHDALSLLLDRLPPSSQGMHLVILSRADPPLPLARLRLRGELTEIRADDLRFTLEEALALLNEVMGLGLTCQQIALLESRTEGWVAGLQLAGLSLQGLPLGQVGGFVETFAGSHRYVMDYLMEEVFSRQPADVQQFLLHTSILDRLCGPLCDAVTDRDDGQAMLEWLDTANLFVVPLDHERHWYRYHHLFTDLLHDRLQYTQTDSLPVLHLRAAEWHERHGLIADAVGHALAAPDFGRAAGLIEQSAPETLARGELGTVLHWIESLPQELVGSRPWLCVYQAWALAHTDRHSEAEALLQCAEQHIHIESRGQGAPFPSSMQQTDAQRILGHVAYVRARVASVRGDVSRAFDLLRRARALLPDRDLLIRCLVAYVLGSTHLTSGDLTGADDAFADAARLGRAADNIHVAGVALVGLAKVRKLQGRLREASSLYQEAARLLNERGRQQSQAMGNVKMGMGDLLREWNDLASARRHLVEGIKCHQRWPNPSSLAFGYGILAQVLQAQRDEQGAFDALQKARHLIQRYDVYPEMRRVVQACEVRLWLAQSNVGIASRRLWESQVVEEDMPGFVHELDQITLARLLIAQKRFDEALGLLARLAQTAEVEERNGRLIEILVLQALGLQAQARSVEAHADLRKALALAEPEDYVRIFVDEGAPMAALLRRALSQNVAPNYVGRLLAAFEEPAALSPLVEPLTRRELEVLRLIADGLKNQEIADRLVISVATVKRHVTNIYGKLGVGRRVQAVARAQELGLL